MVMTKTEKVKDASVRGHQLYVSFEVSRIRHGSVSDIDTSELSALSVDVARIVGRGPGNTGCSLGEVPVRDMEFSFDTVADAKAALNRLRDAGWKCEDESLGPWERVGEIVVDSGHCWVGDPIYIAANAPREYDPEPPGGVTVSTGWGDGDYNVYVRRAEGRIKAVMVVFDEDAAEAEGVPAVKEAGAN